MDAAADDASLLAASQRGDVDAFGQLIERYHNLVCAIAYSRTGDRVASEDIAQDTFFAAWKGIRELREPAKLRGWLCGIARNLASKSHRARRPTDDIGDHEGQLAGDTGPLDAILTKELEAAVWAALEKLPEVYREPLVLFYREDKSVKEVALGLDLTEEAAKQRLSRGREQLRDNLGDLVENTLRAGRSRKAAAAAVLAALIASGAKPALAASGATTKASGSKILFAALAAGAVVGAIALGVSMRRTPAAPSPAAPDSGTTIAELQRARAAQRGTSAVTCSVEGSIAAVDGAALPGATIAILENGWDTPSLEPQFVVGPRWKTALRAGVYTITASAPGHRAHAEVVTCAGVQSVAFALSPGGVTLRGSIDDAGGGPIAAATVWLLDPLRPSEPYVTRSTPAGAYEITVEPGQYTVLVVHPDYIVEARPVTLGASAREDVTLVPGGAIEGTVVDPAGAPIGGAKVTVLAPEKLGDQPVRWQLAAMYGALLPVTTDANGHFALRGLPPGRVRVAARSAAAATTTPVELDLALASTTSGVTLTTAPARPITGFVVAEGRGIANAQVFAIRDAPMTMPVRATTDGAGYFEVAGLTAGPYRLVATAAGFAPSVTKHVSGGEALVPLERGVTVRGTIEASGRPVVKLAAASSTMEHVLRAALTTAVVDARGNFTISGVAPGRYIVSATTFEQRGEAAIDVGAEPMAGVRIPMAVRPALTGEVIDDTGTKLAGVLVSASPGRDPFTAMFSTVRTDEHGAFRIAGLDPGEHDVRVYDATGQRAWANEKRPFKARSVTVPATETLVVASGGAKISGTVLGVDRKPVADVWIEIRARTARRTPEMFPARPRLTDSAGHFEITGVFGDQIRIDAVSTDGTLRAMTTAAPNSAVTLVLAPLVPLTGAVTLDGAPVTAFEVRLRDPQTEDTRRATGANGTFSIASVAGEHELVITAAEGYARRTLAAGTARADVALTRWSSARGKVTGDDGKPWANAHVLVRDGIEPTLARTAVDGTFTLDRLPAGANEITVMHATDARSSTNLHVDLAPGQQLDVGEIDASARITTFASTSADLGLRMFVSASPPTSAQLADKDPRAASRGGSDPDAGLWIVGVTPAGPAARAGLRVGDRVVGVGMSTVSGGKSSVAMMMSLATPWRSKGRAVGWTVVRDGRELRVDVLVP